MRTLIAALVLASAIGIQGAAAAEPADPVAEVASAVETVVMLPVKLLEELTR